MFENIVTLCKQPDLKQEVPQSDPYHVGNMAPTIMACFYKCIVQCGNNTLPQRAEKSNDGVVAFQIVSITEKRMARGDERNQSTSLLMGTVW